MFWLDLVGGDDSQLVCLSWNYLGPMTGNEYFVVGCGWGGMGRGLVKGHGGAGGLVSFPRARSMAASIWCVVGEKNMSRLLGICTRSG